MNPKERYNKIIKRIEGYARYGEEKPVAFLPILAKEQAMAARELDTVMRFMTGKSALEYIKERRMMAIYWDFITGDERDIETAVSNSDYDNHSSFATAFKRYFHKTPTEAFEAKDESLYEESATWESLDSKTIETVPEEEEKRDVIFGLPRERYQRILEASELSVAYNLPSGLCEAAFALAEEKDFLLKDCFAYAHEIREYTEIYWETMCIGSEHKLWKAPEEQMLCEFSRPYLQFAFFQCGIYVDHAIELLFRTRLDEEDLMRINPHFLKTFEETRDVDFDYFWDACEYYLENADDSYWDSDLDRYLDMVCMSIPFQEAFEAISPISDSIDPGDIYFEEIEESDSMEKMAEEELRWANAHLDIEPDMENLAYEEDEFGDNLYCF